MVGVGYGKGASLPEEDVRWLTPAEIETRQQAGERLRLFDARDEHEYAAGSLPGAESLSQTNLMFNRANVQPLVDELLTGGGAHDLVFFANTAGPNTGMTSGREVYVMAYLLEVGLPLKRMARLSGGLRGWADSGRPTPCGVAVADTRTLDGLDALLEQADLSRLRGDALARITLEECAALERPALLNTLKELGLPLADRQALCNAIAKAKREGRIPA
jgi:rhodanese-related sulfurtransferase